METVKTTAAVTVYQVKDEHGNEYPFSADADGDGDIIITLDESPCDNESVKDYAMDNMNELIQCSCETGLRLCLETIKEQQPDLFKEVAEDD